MLIAKIRGPQLAAEGKERQGERTDIFPKTEKGSAHAHVRLADEAKVTKGKALTALEVSKHAKDIIADVVSGKIPLRKAAKIATARKPKRKSSCHVGASTNARKFRPAVLTRSEPQPLSVRVSRAAAALSPDCSREHFQHQHGHVILHVILPYLFGGNVR